MGLADEILNESGELMNSSSLISIKKKKPKRSYTGIVRKTNSANKKLLRKDFSCRCCYCDDHDEIRACKSDYQTEHFAPYTRFKKLKFVYNNLLYSCPTCNRAKWDKWPSNEPDISVVNNEGFLDPCNDEYYLHLARKKSGEIVYLSDLGKYMYENLNLSLGIHVICYKLDRYNELIVMIHDKLNDESIDKTEREKLKKIEEIITKEFIKYYHMKISC